MRKVAVAVVTVAAFLSTATAAWAPTRVAGHIKTEVGNALEQQRTLGYEPCEPALSPLPSDAHPDLAADASIPGDPGVICELRFAANLPDEATAWVVWHEVCHLSTVPQIFADPTHIGIEDPAHHHPAFQECISHGPTERGGY